MSAAPPVSTTRAVTLPVLFAILLLPACAERPQGVLIPVAAGAPGTPHVEMLVATTRKSASGAGELFSGERGATVSYADIAVSIPPDGSREAGTVQWPNELPGNPARDFVAPC